MKKNDLFFLMLAISCLMGCGTTYQYKGNFCPPISSEKYPFFTPTTEIVDSPVFKLALGNGKKKYLTELRLFSPVKEEKLKLNSFPTIFIESDINWELSFKNNQFYYKNQINEVSSSLSSLRPLPAGTTKLEKKKIEIESIHELNGKILKKLVYVDGKQIDPNNDEIIKELTFSIHEGDSPFTIWGKVAKTGDILRNKSSIEPLKNIFGQEIINPEKIKGWGIYKNNRVIVSEYIFDENFRNPENPEETHEIRAKGYINCLIIILT